MDIGGGVKGIVAILVGIIMVALLAIPVIEDLQVGYDRVPQEDLTGTYYYSTEGSHTAAFADSVLTVDGTVVSLDTSVTFTVLASKAVQVVYSVDSSSFTAFSWTEPGEVVSSPMGTSWTMSLTSSGDLTITGDAAMTKDIGSDFVHLSPTDYTHVMTPQGPITVNDGAEVYFVGVGGATKFAQTEVASSGGVSGWYSGNPSAVAWEASVESGVVTIQMFTFTYNGVPNWAQCIAPVSYYELVDNGSSMSKLISIVPLLLIIAIVMMAVRMLGGRE